jgi:hypothetical protein
MKNQLVKMWLSSSLIGLLLVSALAMEIPIHVGATGNTYYIAASNSSSLDKAAANAVCTGTKDQNTINPYLTNGSTVILDNGTYNISGYVFLASNSHLLGTSNVGTVLNFSSSSVCIGDISNVEVGNFAVTGTMSSAVEIITSTANQSGFNIHDIKSTSTGNADADFEVYADNYTVSNIVFNNCDANNPNGYGFLLTGTGAGAIINGITLYNCSVENAGVASTRNSIWIAGYNLGENIVSLNNVALIHCTCNGAWESDFMFDNTVQSTTNAVFLDCNAQNAGQSSSAYYGSGILIPSTAVQAILNGNTGSGNKGGSYTKTHFDISVYNSPYIGYAFPKNLVLGSSQTVTRANQGNCIGIIVTDGNSFDLYLYSSDGNSVNQTLTLPNGNTYAASFSNYQVIRGVTGTFSTSSPSTNTVANWEFNEGSGNIANDSSASNTAMIYSATWTTGVEGYALSFNGNNSYLSCGNSSSLNLTGNLSLEAWIKVPSAPSSDREIIQKGLINWASENYYLELTPAMNVRFGIGNGSSYNSVLSSSSSPLASNNWYQVVGVADGKNLKIYINGVLQGSILQTITPATNSQSVNISVPYSGLAFNGIIDDVSIYNVAITP